MMCLVGLSGILKYATINPPKDLGPRLSGALMFRDKQVLTRYSWVPVVAPFCASPFAVLVYRFLLAEKKGDGEPVEKVIRRKENFENGNAGKSGKRVIPTILDSVEIEQFKMK